MELNQNPRTDSAQVFAVEHRKVKFPHTVRFRSLTAKIYGRSEAYPFYRMAVRVAGKRMVRSFQTFKEAIIFGVINQGRHPVTLHIPCGAGACGGSLQDEVCACPLMGSWMLRRGDGCKKGEASGKISFGNTIDEM